MSTSTESRPPSQPVRVTPQSVIDALEALARDSSHQTASYETFMHQFGMDSGNQQHISTISALLCTASETTYADPARQFMLSVLVVGKATGIPGGGFYKLAKKLGAIAPNERREDFFLRQVQLVFGHYQP